jgi:hypothetical protein
MRERIKTREKARIRMMATTDVYELATTVAKVR